MAGFFMKSFGECCGSMVLMDASCWPSTNCTSAEKIVFVSTKLNYNRLALVFDSDKGLCCHHSFHSLYQGSANYNPRAKSFDLRSHFTRQQNTFANNGKIIYLRKMC